jgi:hypothetical protein
MLSPNAVTTTPTATAMRIHTHAAGRRNHGRGRSSGRCGMSSGSRSKTFLTLGWLVASYRREGGAGREDMEAAAGIGRNAELPQRGMRK